MDGEMKGWGCMMGTWMDGWMVGFGRVDGWVVGQRDRWMGPGWVELGEMHLSLGCLNQASAAEVSQRGEVSRQKARNSITNCYNGPRNLKIKQNQRILLRISW